MSEPTSRHVAAYRPGEVEATADGRLFSPVFERNGLPIRTALVTALDGLAGPALEIGSGTGQHVCAFAAALPGLSFTPSDPDPVHRASIDAWAAHLGAPVAPARGLDAASDWPGAVADLGPLALVIALNVIHIAPFSVARGLVAGAGRALGPGGALVLYGPFRIDGAHTGPGNATFDARLRAENPDWGVRDIADVTALARAAGLDAPEILVMPADNRLLVFRRT
jgi:SAM-dependent methyltransferase